MDQEGAVPDPATLVAETIEYVAVEPNGDGWVGRTPPWFGPVLFGGFVLGQAVHAATRTAPEGARIHSLHGYFLAPMREGPDVDYDVTALRDGRSYASRILHASQEGKPVFTMTCSFTADTDGYEYGRPLADDIPRPDDLEPEIGDGTWEIAAAGPTEPDHHGVMDSSHRIWLRTASELPDDPHLHDAIVAFMTDITWTGARPLQLDGDTRGIISLDHAAWFHRRPRADEWLFYDLHSLVNTGGRGLIRGTVHDRAGQLAVSIAQETALRPYDQFPDPPPEPQA